MKTYNEIQEQIEKLEVIIKGIEKFLPICQNKKNNLKTILKRLNGCFLSLTYNVLQISEGTNSVGIVRLDLGFCLCAVI
jgi:archaellum component FlaC